MTPPPVPGRRARSRLVHLVLVGACLAGVTSAGAASPDLVLQTGAAPAWTPLGAPPPLAPPGLIPHARVSTGVNDIAAAWLEGATDRYPHAVLGDRLEASRLGVRTPGGETHRLTLPERRVFEDLAARLADLDGDGRDEILVVESDRDQGGSLAVYGLRDGELRRIASSPFIGTRFRWLNPLGVGDFDGDGRPEVAVVRTPHIGGVLEIYRFQPPDLVLMARRSGVSTHAIGSTALGLGHVVSSGGRARLLAPDPSHRRLLLIEFDGDSLQVLAEVELPARITGDLVRLAPDRYRMPLADGSHRVVVITGHSP